MNRKYLPKSVGEHVNTLLTETQVSVAMRSLSCVLAAKSSHIGYVRVGNYEVYKYKGRYGVGYAVYSHNKDVKRCNVSYYVKKDGDRMIKFNDIRSECRTGTCDICPHMNVCRKMRIAGFRHPFLWTDKEVQIIDKLVTIQPSGDLVINGLLR